MFKLSKKAQSTAEYAILIAIVVGALVGMQIYVRRGLQGRIADVVDQGAAMSAAAGGGATGYAASRRTWRRRHSTPTASRPSWTCTPQESCSTRCSQA